MVFLNILDALTTISWLTVYIYICVYQLKIKKVLMPYWAMCLNATWEWFFTIIHIVSTTKANDWSSENIITIISLGLWAIVDVIIVYSYCKIVCANSKDVWLKSIGLFISLAIWVGCYFDYLKYTDAHFYQDDRIDSYTAYADNVIMSILFLYSANSKELIVWKPQCLFVGICKLLGTLCATVWGGLFNDLTSSKISIWPYILALGIITLLIDSTYCFLIAIKRKKQKINIWIDFASK